MLKRVDYSQDVHDLKDWEIYEYESQDQHETGINTTRMRLPTRYDIAKYYKRNKLNLERGRWRKKPDGALLDFSDDFDWQITYSFPDTLHSNVSPKGKVYGGSAVTYRRLYLILCERCNYGEFFIDTYFNDVYPHTVKEEIDVALGNIKDELLFYASDVVFVGAVATKKGEFDKRYKVNRGMKKKLKEYERFAQEWEDQKSPELAEIIKRDIISCLETGQIPLNCRHTALTKKHRIWAGYDPDTVFYAMGDLIEHIQLFVRIGGNGQWRTRQGLQV